MRSSEFTLLRNKRLYLKLSQAIIVKTLWKNLVAHRRKWSFAFITHVSKSTPTSDYVQICSKEFFSLHMQVRLYSKWFAPTLVSYVQICSREYFLHRCKCVYTARYGYLSFVNYLLMSKARRINKAFREWLAFRCHTHGLLDQGRRVNILPTVGNYVGSISKMTLSQCHLSTLTNNTASKMPTLAHRMTVIWCYHNKKWTYWY